MQEKGVDIYIHFRQGSCPHQQYESGLKKAAACRRIERPEMAMKRANSLLNTTV